MTESVDIAVTLYASEASRVSDELRASVDLVYWDMLPIDEAALRAAASRVEAGARQALAAAVRALQVAEGLRALANSGAAE